MSAEQVAQGISNGTDVDVSDEQLNRVLQELDRRIGSIIEALPVNGLLIVFTCQGNTAEYRRLQASLLQIYMHTLAFLGVCSTLVSASSLHIDTVV